MSKQIAFLMTGLALTVSSIGCCCLGGYHPYGMNRCAPCGGCPTGAGAMYAPQSAAMINSIDPTQSAANISSIQTATLPNSQIIGAPILGSGTTYPITATVPNFNPY